MARIRLNPDLGSVAEFGGAGVRLPRRQRRRGAQRRNRIRRIAGDVARDEVWFLRDATMSVAAGESVVVVGHQGSGRDQLLRLAVGTLMPDEGTVRRSMPIVPVMNLGGAFSRRYTVRQNIYLLGGLLGGPEPQQMPRQQQPIPQQQPQAQAGGGIGDILGSPLGKAVLGGIAAYAMKEMMGGNKKR